MPSEKPPPKIPAPPSIGGGSEESGGPKHPRLEPPSIPEGKAAARSVGVDTFFIDGLAAGLADEAEQTPDAGRSEDATDSDPVEAPPSDETTRPQAKPVEGVASKPAEDAQDELERLETLVAAPAVEAPPLAEKSAPPIIAARSPSRDAAGPNVPRGLLVAGVGAAALGLILMTRTCGGTDDPVSAGGDRVAAVDGVQRSADDRAAGAGATGDDAEDGVGGGGADRAAAAGDEAEASADTDAPAADEHIATGTGAEQLVIEIEEAGDGSEAEGAEGGGGSSRGSRSGSHSETRAAEDAMSAEELLAEAKEAYEKGRARDAYRLANQSHRKKKSNEALEVKAKAACRMNDKDLAKSALKKLPLGSARRDVRQACRDHGVRVGL